MQHALLSRQSKQHNTLDRYLGAVIFADVSGFSNLGDALERREHEEMEAGRHEILPGAPTASEELARILGKEVEKMVEDVTRGGGDVIKFAGDCVIAVFPADQYMDLPETGQYGSLALATGQAVRVSVQMMQAKNLFLFKSQQEKQQYDDEIAKLVSKLNIHIAIGAGEVYGYHVGGVSGKWDYLISGPVMEQVRSADADSGAGEVVLSKEAFSRLKKIKMRKTFLESGNVKLETYFGPTEEPPFSRPWEKIKDQPQLCEALANKLQSYVPKPLVHQVESGNTLWLAGKKQISTIFCRLIGIDYSSKQGATAVIQLAEIITQVQAILVSAQGTLTRVISDDKGTSMLIAFDHPQHAVDAAIAITAAVEAIPVSQDTFRTAIGITTGVVFCGPVGGRIRAEYTMHGSVVNFSARLMTCPLIKNSGGILCDEQTAQLATRTEFVAQAPRHFKGFEKDVVSYMPTRRKASMFGRRPTEVAKAVPPIPEFDQAPTDFSDALSVDWEARLKPALDSSLVYCVVVVETDVNGHWDLDQIKNAVKIHRASVSLSNLCFNDQDQELNRTELQRLAQAGVAFDHCIVLEKADSLDSANWELLYALCTATRPSRNADSVGSKSGGVIVVTIDPFPGTRTDLSRLPQAYLNLVSSADVVYEKLHATAAVEDRAESSLTVPEEITLEVAAVVAAGTADQRGAASRTKPYFCLELLVTAHPYVKTERWASSTIHSHIDSLCASGHLVKQDGKRYAFVSSEIQAVCYKQVLHEYRMPIHITALEYLDTQLTTEPDDTLEGIYRQMRFHSLCIGVSKLCPDLIIPLHSCALRYPSLLAQLLTWCVKHAAGQ